MLRGCTHATPRNPSPFGAPLFSLLGYYSREKMYTIIAELDTLEMSDKSIYQSQNGSRNIYTIIIHANIFSQHRRTSSAIHMERTTTRHFLSHRTTYLQYRSPYHAYSLSQQSTILSWPTYSFFTSYNSNMQTRETSIKKETFFILLILTTNYWLLTTN